MGVNVDETRGDQQALGVDFFPALAGYHADGRNLAVHYRDVTVKKRIATTVRDAAASDYQIIAHRLPPKWPVI